MQTFNLVQCFVAGSPSTLSNSLTTNLHLDYFHKDTKNPLPNLLLLWAKQQLITPRVDHELTILWHNPCWHGAAPSWSWHGLNWVSLLLVSPTRACPWTNLNFFLKSKNVERTVKEPVVFQWKLAVVWGFWNTWSCWFFDSAAFEILVTCQLFDSDF